MSRKQADLLFSVTLLIVMFGMAWMARDWAARARLFPWVIAVPAVVLAVLQVVFAVRNLRREARSEMVAEPLAVTEAQAGGSERRAVAAAVEEMLEATTGTGEPLPAASVRRRALEMCGWLLVFALGAALLGFRLGAGLLTLAFLRLAAGEPWRLAIAIALGTYLMFAFGFDFALGVHLPAGIVSDWLGLPSLDAYLLSWIPGR